jgi:GrpB-like predicted nucleotidyltransferase (UPF0157 family)
MRGLLSTSRKEGAMPELPNQHLPVNAPTPVNGPIRIVPYDPAWPAHYEVERGRIAAALGARALEIHHVGSTSVPGLAAKPIVDILLVVADCADEPAYLPTLEAAGYVLRVREPADDGNPLFTGTEPHRVFKGAAIDLNLHVWSAGSTEIERTLAFRDWLRANPDDRELYERTKLALAVQGWANVQQYADAKSAVIAEIHARVRADRDRDQVQEG